MSCARLVLCLIAHLFAGASIAQSTFPETTNTCLRRSVVVYTSGAETFVVTDFGSTNFDTPTVCSNLTAIPSTVYASASTVTVFQGSSGLPLFSTSCPAVSDPQTVTSTLTLYAQPTSTQASTDGPATSASIVVADNGFENGTASALNGTTTDEGVSAAVIEGTDGPLAPYEGNNFLLITFNSSTSANGIARRQATNPLVYNATQFFSAEAGKSYTLSAYAIAGQNGALGPDCSIVICGDSSCGSSSPLTTSYVGYSYAYNALITEPGAIATFSLACSGRAYVGLDNITISSGASLPPSAASVVTTTVTQVTTRVTTQITTQVMTRDQSVLQTQVITSVLPGSTILTTQVLSGSTQTITTVLPASTVLYTVTQPQATALTTQVATSVLPASTIVTTQFLSGSAITVTSVIPPSTIVQTQTVTVTPDPQTQIVTTVLPASTLITTQLISGSIEIVTTVVPPSTIFQTVVQSASGVERTIISTQTITTVLPASTSYLTTSISGSIQTVTTVLPASTILHTVTQDIPTTIVSTANGITVTQAASAEVVTLGPSTLYQTLQPTTITFTPSPVTQTVTPYPVNQTVAAIPGEITTNLTVTEYITQTLGPNNITIAPDTVVVTHTLGPNNITLSPTTIYVTQTLAMSTSALPICSEQSVLFSSAGPSQLYEASAFCSSFMRPAILAVSTATITAIISAESTATIVGFNQTSIQSLYVTTTPLAENATGTQTDVYSLTSTRYDVVTNYITTRNIQTSLTTEITTVYVSTTYILSSMSSIPSTSSITSMSSIPPIKARSVLLPINTLESAPWAEQSLPLPPMVRGAPISSTQSLTTTTSSDAIFGAMVRFATPAVWSTYLAQASDACKCILSSAGLTPTTSYTSTTWITANSSTVVPVTATSTNNVLLNTTQLRTQNGTRTLTTTISTPIFGSTQQVTNTTTVLAATSSVLTVTSTSVVNATATLTCAANAIANPGFETGSLASWSFSTSAYGSVNAVQNKVSDSRGSWFVQVNMTQSGSGSYALALLQDRRTVCPGATYQFSFDYACSVTSSNIRLDCILTVFSREGQPLRSLRTFLDEPCSSHTPGIWYTASNIYQLGPEASWVSIQPYVSNVLGATRSVSFDNFILAPQIGLQSSSSSSSTIKTASTSSASSASSTSPSASSLPCSGTYTTADGYPWQLSCTTDRFGDFKVIVTSNMTACIQACDDYGLTCNHVTWVSAGQSQQNCYLKNSANTASTLQFPSTITAQSALRRCIQSPVLNPGFESGLTNWTLDLINPGLGGSGASTTAGAVPNPNPSTDTARGNTVLREVIGPSNPTAFWLLDQPQIRVCASTAYTISFDYQCTVADAALRHLTWLYYYKEGNVYAPQFDNNVLVLNCAGKAANTWISTGNLSFTTPAGIAMIDLQTRFYSSFAGVAGFLMDNVRITPVSA